MDDSISEAFKALGQPHRLEIMRRLLARSLSCCETMPMEDCSLDPRYCNFGELAGELTIDNATVSHHLKELDRAGLIERIRVGRRVFVRANLKAIDGLRAFFDPRTQSITEMETK